MSYTRGIWDANKFVYQPSTVDSSFQSMKDHIWERAKSFDDFEGAMSPEGLEYLRELHEKYGSPYIQQRTEGDGGVRMFDQSTPYFVPGQGNDPDTLGVWLGRQRDDFIEEIAHSAQYRPKGLLDISLRDSLQEASIDQFDKYGTDTYETPGTVEYQAHKEISPKMFEEYRKRTAKYSPLGY